MRTGLSHNELRWFSRTLPPPQSIPALRERIGRMAGASILESVAGDSPRGRFSIFTTEPVAVALSDPSNPVDPFAQLAAELRPKSYCSRPDDVPFVGGWIGHIAYEALQYTEPKFRRGESSTGVLETYHEAPLSRWALYDAVLLHDHTCEEWKVVWCELPGRLRSAKAGESEERARRLAEAVSSSVAPAHRPIRRRTPDGEWNYSRGTYLEKVRRALDYIRAGDIYQVNLARRFRVNGRFDPVELYQRLCDCNPANYAAYLDSGDAAILSSSPELFLSVRGREVTTRPIKGTRPRGRDAAGDKAAMHELAASEKDRAELNMIIDLERNDVGRVCEYGSVKVVHDGEVERNPTVFHRTATIQGRLREGADAIDLLRASFPGGSITGAPKVRAMQIIRELEVSEATLRPDPRGPYCGAIGYIGLDGDMQLNLAIRTLTRHANGVDLFVGSGIVADSIPEDEFDELEAKAAGMMNALREKVENVAERVEQGVTADA